jgi:hypothetical protein
MRKKKDYNKKQGLKYYRKGQYIKAIAHLEKALKAGRDDYEIYLFLGYASIFTDDIEGARGYFRRGLRMREDNEELLKGLAYVYLKDERIEDAISLWGEVLEKNPRDRLVKRAIRVLRESGDVQGFIDRAQPRQFLSLKPPFYIKMRPYLIGLSITLGVLIVGIVFYTTPLYRMALEKFYPQIVQLDSVQLPSGAPMSEEAQEALYSFTDKEIETSFARIKKYIYKNKMNMAIVSLNRIMLSNATPLTKEKFEILYEFIDTPDPLALDYNPQPYEIMKEPAAFTGVYVRWTGKIASLNKDKQSAEFDLLVNYEDEDTIEGIAHVIISGNYHIENRQNVELFGSYHGYDRETGKLMIHGTLLRILRM